jgi:chromosomal replication initiation ATPase DnaA
MEAIKLPHPFTAIFPKDTQLLHDRNASLEVQNRALRLEVERLQIECARQAEVITRLEELVGTADSLCQQPKLSLKDITALVCAYKGIREESLKTVSRKRELVYARGLCYYLCTYYGGETTISMGRYFGRDHTTAIAGRDLVADQAGVYDDVKKDVEELEKQIKSILSR